MKRAEESPSHMDELESALVHLRRVWQHPRLKQLFLEYFGKEMEMGAYRALRAIEGLERPELGLGEVAAAMDVDASTASRLVDRVVEMGMVERTAWPADRRRVRLQLSEKGKGYLARARSARMRVLQQVTHGWEEDDIAQFVVLLKRLSGSIENL